MTKKALIPLTLAAALAGCTSHIYTIKIQDPATGKPKTASCNFPQGKKIKFSTAFQNSQLQLGFRYTNSRERSSLSAGAALTYSSQLPAVYFGKEDAALSVSTSDLGFYSNGLSISFLGGKVGTPLLSVGGNGLSFIPARLLPLYLISKSLDLLNVTAYYAENRGTEQANQAVLSTFKKILFKDLLPYYSLRKVFYDFKRAQGISSPVEGENLDEVLQRILDGDSNPEKLSLVESNLNRYPELRGELQVLYDRLLLNESHFFFKEDIKDGKNVHDKITQNIRTSQKSLEARINTGFSKETYWSHLADLYHVSSLADVQILSVSDKKTCEVKMGGTYLFLADRQGTDDIFQNLLKAARYYRQKGFRQLQARTLEQLAKTLQSLDKPEQFKTNFESFFYSHYYLTSIHQNFSPKQLSYLSYYLGSRGKEKLARQLSSVGPLPQLAIDSRLVSYLQGIYDLVKKKEFPTHPACPDLVQEPTLDLKKIINRYYNLNRHLLALERKKSPNVPFYHHLRDSYRQKLADHLKKYPGEFNYYWHQAEDDYFRNMDRFWRTVRLINSYDLDYNLTDIPALEARSRKEDYRHMYRLYRRLQKTEGVDKKDLKKLDFLLQKITADLTFKYQAEQLGFQSRPLRHCTHFPTQHVSISY